MTRKLGVLMCSAVGVVGLGVPVTGQSVSSDKPALSAAGVLNGASFQPLVAPYTWVSLFGSSLSPSTREWRDSDFAGGRLPTELDGVSVQFNGTPGYVAYVSPTQVNVLLPDIAGDGNLQVQVLTTRDTSLAVSVPWQRRAPALFVDGSRYVAAVHGDGIRVGASASDGASVRPARTGDTVMLFGTGFGSPGVEGADSQLISTAIPMPSKPKAWVGGLQAEVLYAGLVMPGVYQLNLVIPPVGDGDWPITIETDSFRTQADAVIPVRGSGVTNAARLIIIDHTTTDLSKIPDVWIDKARQNSRLYLGHTSHGTQITEGMGRLKSQYGSRYSVAVDQALPPDRMAVRIMDASTYDWDPDFYPTVASTLRSNPEINIVMYVWCTQPTRREWQDLLNDYIRDMQSLEKQFPNVTFVYVTGNAQENDCSGCDRHQFNEGLRKFVRENGKVLFDFGDLDAWAKGTMRTYSAPNWCSAYGCAGGTLLPVEHTDWGGGDYNNPCGHANYASCDNKAKAMWWLLVRIAGWDGASAPSGTQ